VTADVVTWVLDGLLLVGCAFVVGMARVLRRERLALRELRLRLSALQASIGEPVAFRRADGHITVEWPSEDTRHCLVARELLDQIVDELNAARGVS